jgi:hypothetical protein
LPARAYLGGGACTRGAVAYPRAKKKYGISIHAWMTFYEGDWDVMGMEIPPTHQQPRRQLPPRLVRGWKVMTLDEALNQAADHELGPAYVEFGETNTVLVIACFAVM